MLLLLLAADLRERFAADGPDALERERVLGWPKICKLAQKLGQLQPLMVVFLQECMEQLALSHFAPVAVQVWVKVHRRICRPVIYRRKLLV